MDFVVLFERVKDTGFPPGFYYAHVPALGLTTQGEGIECAHAAARDLIGLWMQERQAVLSEDEFRKL